MSTKITKISKKSQKSLKSQKQSQISLKKSQKSQKSKNEIAKITKKILRFLKILKSLTKFWELFAPRVYMPQLCVRVGGGCLCEFFLNGMCSQNANRMAPKRKGKGGEKNI